MTETDLERRLRGALAARAATVTGQDLRPVPAPSRSARARWWLPLTAGLAAAAVSITAFVVLRPADPAPVPPASPASPPAAASPPASAAPASPAASALPARPAPSAPLPFSPPAVSPPGPSRSPATAAPTPTASRPDLTLLPTPH